MPWIDQYSPAKAAKKAFKRGMTKSSNRRRAPAGSMAASVEVRICSGECKSPISEDDDKVVGCSRCDKYYCTVCLDISDEVYEALARPDLFWFCPSCYRKAKACWESDAKFEEQCDKFMGTVEKKLGALEKQVEEKFNVCLDQMQKCSKEMPEKVKQSFAEAVKNSAPIQPVQTTPNLTEIMKEAMDQQKKAADDQEARGKNIIIYNVEESTNNTADERITDDTQFFNSLCGDVLQLGSYESIKIVRIGAKTQADGTARDKPRPLKVTMGDCTDKVRLLKSLSKLRNAEERFKKISVTCDYSRDERDKIREKAKEAANMTEEDPSKNFVFRVRGPPWNLRIIKIKKNQQ